MNAREVFFDKELATRPPGLVALVGGGGKTTLLFALARALAGQGVLCTTTTRMARPDPSDWLAVDIVDDPGRIRRPADGVLFASRPPPPGGDPDKVYGFSAEEADGLHRRFPGWTLVEADGAARCPLKAPAAHEPVVPALASAVVAVVGLGCLFRPFSADVAFRLAEISAITGLAEGDPITPAAVAALAVHPEGLFKNTPPSAARILFCNQADTPGIVAGGHDIAAILAKTRPGALTGLYTGSLQRKGLACLAYPTE